MHKKANEKIAKDKRPVTIYKVLHKLIIFFKLLYELCIWVKAVVDLFL